MPSNLNKKTLTLVAIFLFLVVAIFVGIGIKEYLFLSSRKPTTKPPEAGRQIIPEKKTAPPTLTPEKIEIIKKLENHVVTIQNQSFSPAKLTIKPHDQVEWQNKDNETYRIKGEGWGDVPIGPGKSFTQSFKTPGTFFYSCALHPGLTGTIVVE